MHFQRVTSSASSALPPGSVINPECPYHGSTPKPCSGPIQHCMCEDTDPPALAQAVAREAACGTRKEAETVSEMLADRREFWEAFEDFLVGKKSTAEFTRTVLELAEASRQTIAERSDPDALRSADLADIARGMEKDGVA